MVGKSSRGTHGASLAKKETLKSFIRFQVLDDLILLSPEYPVYHNTRAGLQDSMHGKNQSEL